MFYRLVFTKTSKSRHLLKIVLLITGLICDIALVFGLILAILGSYINLITFFVGLTFSIVFRLVALTLIYDIECKLQGGKLIISKIYPNKTQIVLSEELNNLKVYEYNNLSDTFAANCIDLFVKEDGRYLIEGKNVKVLCNLDKYIYASILEGNEI